MNTYYINNLYKFKKYVDSRNEIIPTHDLSKLFWYSKHKFSSNEFNPTVIIQLGIYYVEKGDISNLNLIIKWLEENSVIDKRGINWEYEYPYPSYRLEKYFTSGMTQGLALSLFIRAKHSNMLEESKDYLIATVYDNLNNTLNLHVTPNEIFPIQEFPSKPASNILNGYIFVLYGLLDAKTHNYDNKNLFEHYFMLLDKNIHKFKLFNQSVYDIFKTEIDQGYLNLHIEQLTTLLLFNKSENISKYLLDIEWKKKDSNIHKLIFVIIKIFKQIRLITKV